MTHYPDPKAISVRMTKLPLPEPGPHVSKEPWLGFTRHDCPRGNPLPLCPSLRCRRAKACHAAHDGLYCRRTHFSPSEQRKWESRDPHQRAMDAVPPVTDEKSLAARLRRLCDILVIRLAQRDEMTARWRAGEFDHLYGPYRARGIVMRAPPKAYVERPANSGAKGAGQGRAGDV
jgi:hypothetical protein